MSPIITILQFHTRNAGHVPFGEKISKSVVYHKICKKATCTVGACCHFQPWLAHPPSPRGHSSFCSGAWQGSSCCWRSRPVLRKRAHLCKSKFICVKTLEKTCLPSFQNMMRTANVPNTCWALSMLEPRRGDHLLTYILHFSPSLASKICQKEPPHIFSLSEPRIQMQ